MRFSRLALTKALLLAVAANHLLIALFGGHLGDDGRNGESVPEALPLLQSFWLQLLTDM